MEQEPVPEEVEAEVEVEAEAGEEEVKKVAEGEGAEEAEGEGAEEAEEEEDGTDAEIEAIKKRVAEMEEEAAKIEALQHTVEKSMKTGAGAGAATAGGPAVDARSIYVGSVDYSTTNDELKEFFKSCGTVNRVTIGTDKWSGQPKGYAYVEFSDSEAIVNAMILNETPFKGRPLKIAPKRTNIAGYSARGRGRGRGGFRGRGRRGGYYGGRGRRARGYHPYY